MPGRTVDRMSRFLVLVRSLHFIDVDEESDSEKRYDLFKIICS